MVYTFSWILRFMYVIHIFDCLLDISAWLFRKMNWAGPNSLDSPSSSPQRFSIHFPGKNTGMGFHFLLQGIFLTERLKLYLLGLLHWEVDSLPLSHQESLVLPENTWNICFFAIPYLCYKWYLTLMNPHDYHNLEPSNFGTLVTTKIRFSMLIFSWILVVNSYI